MSPGAFARKVSTDEGGLSQSPPFSLAVWLLWPLGFCGDAGFGRRDSFLGINFPLNIPRATKGNCGRRLRIA
jgi:hypothetical protein